MELHFNDDSNWVQVETTEESELIEKVLLLIEDELHFSFYKSENRFILKMLYIDFLEVENEIMEK